MRNHATDACDHLACRCWAPASKPAQLQFLWLPSMMLSVPFSIQTHHDLSNACRRVAVVARASQDRQQREHLTLPQVSAPGGCLHTCKTSLDLLLELASAPGSSLTGTSVTRKQHIE